ncbi:DNA-directed RNA polymerase sigma-70 factor [Sphaerisporangium rufum]|uniref:DNA-directed RNA polymerase sigma-70 factor n=1 Tax=Sphaerisporangium rufum TaxID=1381558 RepID=A0A919RA05_9ACTN|nr:RNA polymerase sigma factor [Sphaerisporangium rufum]GII80075.1 DNA-directed RNA polymerase sigma-70 factor [Sphaerisporangium rufum]
MTAGVAGPATDAELAAGLAARPELFAVVHDRYFRDIFRYAAGRLDAQTAEDIAAETFLTAYDQRDRFDPARGGLRPWLFGIATNLIARHRRKEARHYAALARVVPERDAEGPENRVLTSVAAQRMRPRLVQAMALLTPGERDVVLLVALGRLGYQEVAEALGISAGTVGSRLSRARAKLHDVLDPEAFHG